MSNYNFDTNVPIPVKRFGSSGGPRKSKYSFLAELNVNQSVFVPHSEIGVTKVSSAVNRFGKRLGRTFTTRRRDETGIYGTRIWRTG